MMKTAIVCLFAAIPLVAQSTKVSFVKDVMPALNKAGCTSGPCHGSAKGKNGFKLSLRGYDPEADYRAIVHELSGRRFNRTEPEQSLILLKPSMGVPHGGGLRFEPGQPYYQAILEWIRQGCEFGDPVAAQVTKLEVQPPETTFEKQGKQQLKVTAHYADGSTRDVTRDAQYTSNTPVVANIDDNGQIQTEREGEAAMLVRYEGKLSVVPVTVLTERPGFAWKALPEANYIDRFINTKLQRVKVLPSAIASDGEFLRRVSYDLIGLPPSVEEARAFLADKDPLKRTKAIDRLMARPEFVNHWALKWSDLLQVNRTRLGDKGMWAFREWIRESLATNKPYDAMVRELITAKGSTYQNPPANFLRFTRDPKVAMETTTQLFLGVRMVCAQCHDHPFEQWTQNQYFHLSAFFAGVGIKDGNDSAEEIIYEKQEDNHVKHPKDGRLMSPKFLYGGEDMTPQEADLRAALADWLVSPKNRLFAKAMANRTWSYFFGRGIIEPVDDIRASNPPSNPELLEALTEDFIKSKYDLRKLIRTVVTSSTYQTSFQPNEWNEKDELNFSHFMPRRLSAEQLFDGVYRATGTKPHFRGVPPESVAQDLPDPTIGKGGFLDLFGRPERQTSCECERRTDLSLVQALNLLNGATIADSIADEDGRIATLVRKGLSDRDLVSELYLAALSRPPSTQELDFALTYLGRGMNRTERAQDLLWALLNSNAFLFNR
jgi:hypothetical protein